MTNTNGGAAFPHQAKDAGYPGYQPGLTIRDWFAGQALAGMMAHPDWSNGAGWNWNSRAREAYLAADALLAARGSGQ